MNKHNGKIGSWSWRLTTGDAQGLLEGQDVEIIVYEDRVDLVLEGEYDAEEEHTVTTQMKSQLCGAVAFVAGRYGLVGLDDLMTATGELWDAIQKARRT